MFSIVDFARWFGAVMLPVTSRLPDMSRFVVRVLVTSRKIRRLEFCTKRFNDDGVLLIAGTDSILAVLASDMLPKKIWERELVGDIIIKRAKFTVGTIPISNPLENV